MIQFANYPSLADKTVLMTGGASGIGASIVRAFSAQGAHVGFVDFDENASENLTKELPNVCYEIADLRDIPALRGAFKALIERLGAPAVLVNNAARDDRHAWEDVTEEYYDERIASNIRQIGRASCRERV